MKIDIEQLPKWAKLEVSKDDLLAFAEKLRIDSEKESLPEKAPEKDELLNFEEMCAFLVIAKSTGYQRIARGEIPHFKKGRRLYFWKLELVQMGGIRQAENKGRPGGNRRKIPGRL